MNIRPYLQFYKSIFLYVAAFSFVGVVAFGVFYGFIFFLTFGLVFGFFAFHIFYKEQWFTYQNLGITKLKIFITSLLLNLIIGVPIFLFLFILISFIIGDFSLTPI